MGAGQLGSDHARRDGAASLPARRTPSARQCSARRDESRRSASPPDLSTRRSSMQHIAYYSLRSTVHPGVTGWAQVRYGYANNIEEETEKMRYDPYSHQEPVSRPRRQNPSGDRRNRPDRPRGQPSPILTDPTVLPSRRCRRIRRCRVRRSTQTCCEVIREDRRDLTYPSVRRARSRCPCAPRIGCCRSDSDRMRGSPHLPSTRTAARRDNCSLHDGQTRTSIAAIFTDHLAAGPN